MLYYYKILFRPDISKVIRRYGCISGKAMRQQCYYDLAVKIGVTGRDNQAIWELPVLSFFRGGWNYECDKP
jgi:hypothetical protein